MMNNAEKWAKKMVKRGDRWWTMNHHVEKLQVSKKMCNFASSFIKPRTKDAANDGSKVRWIFHGKVHKKPICISQLLIMKIPRVSLY